MPQGLPEPKFTRIEDDIVERGRFVMPKAYIDFVPKCEAELDATVEYDADEEVYRRHSTFISIIVSDMRKQRHSIYG